MIELTYQEDGRVAVVLLDGGPVNVLTSELLLELADVLDEIDSGEARVIVIGSAIDGVFASGGDVDLVSRTDSAGFVAYMHAMREAVAGSTGCPPPSIAAIDGAAFGGGLELALACTIRVAADGRPARAAAGQARHDPGGRRHATPAADDRPRPRAGPAGHRPHGGAPRRPSRWASSTAAPRRAPARGRAGARARDRRRPPRPPSARSAARPRPRVDRSFPEGMAVEAREALQLFERGEAREGFAAFLDNRPPNFA